VDTLVAARGRAFGKALATLGVVGASLLLAALLKWCHVVPIGIGRREARAGGSLKGQARLLLENVRHIRRRRIAGSLKGKLLLENVRLIIWRRIRLPCQSSSVESLLKSGLIQRRLASLLLHRHHRRNLLDGHQNFTWEDSYSSCGCGSWLQGGVQIVGRGRHGGKCVLFLWCFEVWLPRQEGKLCAP
jgi:hypothetical protein